YGPTQNNVPGELIYRFDHGHPVTSATLNAWIGAWNLTDFGGGSGKGEVTLSASADGADWVELMAIPIPDQQGIGRTYDDSLPENVIGGPHIWIRVVFQVYGASNSNYTVAQFSRSNAVTDDQDAPSIFQLITRTEGGLQGLSIDEDAPEQTVDLSDITAGSGETQPLRVTASSSNTSLIADPTVHYTSADTIGSITFTPLADQHGISTITVTVEDGGLDNNLATTADNATTSKTFKVTVNPVNDIPALDPISDLTLDEDGNQQTVDLTGITAGGGETQPLRATATSSNTDLIANPTVAYTSAESTGSLSFTPLADQYGTSTITVIVEDGGLDNDLATTADNATTSETFNVTVNPVNDLPTLDPISDLPLDEDAPEQTVNLTGITAGGGESQPLRVTATSTNKRVIADPTVDYMHGETTGTLKLTPALHVSGESTVTVTVEDGGLDNNLATTADNLSVTTDFVVTVREIYEWYNYDHSEDVNNDEIVTTLDALIVINHLNTHGATLLPEDKPADSPWYDVSKDGWVSPIDAMVVINYLNPSNYEVRIGVVPLDGNGNQLSHVVLGDVFYLALMTEDLRDAPAGVFAAYADVYYASSHLTFAGTPVYESPYINGTSADLTESGLINEWGAFAGLDETHGGTYIVSRVPMKAIKAGVVLFGASTADVLPSHDVLVYQDADRVKPSSIEYAASELQILDGAEGEFWSSDSLVDADLIDQLVQYQGTDIASLDQFFGQF
ncbi:MAG: dockerin type I domain-containing protein, partial [Pseudomonadales bacterium]|nr:dockerin type I domain-containing protein [Pseudomonadales bacterium]